MPNFQRNEYFGRAFHVKICDCKLKSDQIYFWGAFVCKQFHHIKFFCPFCFDKSVKENLIKVKEASNCKINILGFRRERLPFFLLNLASELKENPQSYLPILEESEKGEKNANRANCFTSNNSSGFLFQL